MKYMLMMNTMKAGAGISGWPQEDLQAHIAFMLGLNKELHKAGELVFAEGLAFPDQAKLVRAGKGGLPITDGVAIRVDGHERLDCTEQATGKSSITLS
jgi:hypothetical protein